MNSVLVINSSARQQRSITRQLIDTLLNELTDNIETDVVHRDVGAQPPGFIDEQWIDAVFTSPQQRSASQQARLAESERLIAELKNASIIVIGAPMYNYGMPAALKAWFDQIIRVDKTFSFDLSRGDYPIEPLLNDKTLVLLTSKGEFGFSPEGPRAMHNHLDNHIQTLSRYLGASRTHEVHVEYQEFSDDRHQYSLNAARLKAKELGIKLRS
ncbi:FMN-dependent NADH-azoreductase [Endozoicomonas sp. OPT23]|uniref:FMN-dependent NADH-azoreductase n=1 Tax=Endozoicomonas sp. OPT23 TaxID=2072845 RepID=UPI00129A2A8D|nr:NAD(P)H-dependent oxidoreductase [Endozoicomonas sp. OPT23]MRI35179.1 FMN-dependent NADH-azoreductase [Endozoicomonas sp. OPT23]